jgi:hypothetical protein
MRSMSRGAIAASYSELTWLESTRSFVFSRTFTDLKNDAMLDAHGNKKAPFGQG